MKVYKKQRHNINRNLYLLISILLAFSIACQQEDKYYTLSDAEHQNLLKSTMIESGRYTGNYNGGEWLISMPDSEIWNSSFRPVPRCMIFYAHGMVFPVPYEEVQLPADTLLGGLTIENLVTDMLTMGYATTSYRDNGLVVMDAIYDIQQLVVTVKKFFIDHTEYLPPEYLILGGPSEGGLVTVKTLEKFPQLFDGGLSICGPAGSFYDQIQHNGDFHVLFNYFFGNELAQYGMVHFGEPIYLGNPEDGVSPHIMSAWQFNDPFDLKAIILGIMSTFPERVPQLLNCANVDVPMIDYIMAGAVLDLLRYNIFLTNDVIERMKGVPYTNIGKWYEGSANDELLNASVQRIYNSSYHRACKFVEKLETSGRIRVPLALIHTTGDHITPFWHQEKYAEKIMPGSENLVCRFDIDNYGHCTISAWDILAALECIGAKIDPEVFSNFEIIAGTLESTGIKN